MMLAPLVNFVLPPALAIGLSRVIPLQPAHATGLLMLSSTAGAPFLPKLTEVSGASLAYSVALMLLLMVGSILFMPLALPLIVPGPQSDAGNMARPLLLLMLVPLAIGLALGRGGASWVARLPGFSQRVSNLAFALLVVPMVGMNLETMAGTIGSCAIGTYVLYVLGRVGAGVLLGGADASKRTVFALGGGSCNIVAALVVTSAGFGDPPVTVMLLVASVTGPVLLLALATILRPKVAG